MTRIRRIACLPVVLGLVLTGCFGEERGTDAAYTFYVPQRFAGGELILGPIDAEALGRASRTTPVDEGPDFGLAVVETTVRVPNGELERGDYCFVEPITVLDSEGDEYLVSAPGLCVGHADTFDRSDAELISLEG